MTSGEPNTAKLPLRKRVRTRRFWGRWVKRLLIAGVALFVLALLVRSVWMYVATRQLYAQLAAIHEQGGSLTLAELMPEAGEIDVAEDAGRYYAAAMDLVVPVDHFGEQFILEDGGITPENEQAARRVLEVNAPTLEMVARASALPESSPVFRLEGGFIPVLADLDKVRQLARVQGLKVEWLVYQGREAAAAEAIVDMIRIGRMFEKSPILIVNMVDNSFQAITAMEIKQWLNDARPSTESIERVIQAWEPQTKAPDLRRMLEAERALTLQLMAPAVALPLAEVHKRASPVPQGVMLEQWPPANFWNLPLMRSFAVGYLKTLGAFIDAAELEWPEVHEQFHRIEPKGLFGGFHVLSQQHLITLLGRALVQARATYAALRVEAYRLKHGALPESLAVIAEDAPKGSLIDPFTGEPLHYRVEDGSYVIYSVGDDRQDDGGKLADVSRNETRDWGVRIELPEAKGRGGR